MKMKLLTNTLHKLFMLPIISLATIPPISSCASTQNKFDLMEKLLQNPEIVAVNCVPNTRYKQFYVVHIQQPLDWNKPEGKKFTQRFMLGFNGYSNVNYFYVSGYAIKNQFIGKTPGALIPILDRYNCNFIWLEHRFYGGSKPNDYNPRITNNWDALTLDNAMKDFHHINIVLRKILTGKWIMNGASKGGQATNIYSAMFPDDINAFIADCAPCCHYNNSTDLTKEQNKLVDVCLNTIGDDSSLGKEEAEKMRFEIFKFQTYLLNQTNSIYEDFYRHCCYDLNESFSEAVNKNPKWLYYASIMDMNCSIWQNLDYAPDAIEKIKAINDITESEKKLTAAKQYVNDELNGGDLDINHYIYTWEVQGWKDMGLHNWNPQLFINKAQSYKDAGKTEIIVPTFDGIDKNDYATFRYKCLFSEDFRQKISFDDSVLKKLESWKNTTTSNVIMIFGAKDPWSVAYGMREITNPHIHVYTLANQSHSKSKIPFLPEQQRNECYQLLDSWVK